jgi:hypothetical protein
LEAFVYQEPANDLTQEAGSTELSPPPSRAIFRSEALEHYIQNQEKVELPRLISLKFFRFLWISALLLMVAGSIFAFWPLIEQLL